MNLRKSTGTSIVAALLMASSQLSGASESKKLPLEPSFFCAHNGEIFALVFGDQPCPEYVPWTAKEVHVDDEDCIVSRTPTGKYAISPGRGELEEYLPPD